jgi:SAM-dependent methyltransferase
MMSLILRAHELARRVPQLLARGLDAATLALFSVEQLDALTASYYARTPLYRGDAHNAGGLFSWEREIIDAHFPKNGTLLVTSAGAGREVLALAHPERRIVATECVPSLVAELRRRAPNHDIHLLPPDQIPPGTFDAAVVGWTAYSHLAGRDRRVAFLRRLARALRPGAPLLLSYWANQHGHPRGALAVARAANRFRRRAVEPGESTALGFFIRSFAPGETAAEAHDAGFIAQNERFSPYAHLLMHAKFADFQALR